VRQLRFCCCSGEHKLNLSKGSLALLFLSIRLNAPALPESRSWPLYLPGFSGLQDQQLLQAQCAPQHEVATLRCMSWMGCCKVLSRLLGLSRQPPLCTAVPAAFPAALPTAVPVCQLLCLPLCSPLCLPRQLCQLLCPSIRRLGWESCTLLLELLRYLVKGNRVRCFVHLIMAWQVWFLFDLSHLLEPDD
jgi:hypothetical protein